MYVQDSIESHFVFRAKKNKRKRKKREIEAIGNFAAYFCDLVTERQITGIKENEITLTRHYRIIREAVKETNQRLFDS